MAFWWVNHKQTRDLEVGGRYLWSPMRNANDRRNASYDAMKQVRRGDLVFSYANGFIGAVGRVTEVAMAAPKPTEFGNIGDYWANEGWLVEVDFVPVPKPLRPKAHIERIGPLLPSRHSPIRASGDGNQGTYLAAIPDSLGLLLMALLGADQVRELDAIAPFHVERAPDAELLDDIRDIDVDASIPETQRVQLAKARVGQGLFRKRVMLIDGACRVTGVSDVRLLVASHIKPWRASNNAERVNGFNGLLLSPHIDALFDDHLITFEDDGRMHVHTSLAREVLDRWSIDPDRRVEAFRYEQREFMSHHRSAFAARG
ncbi:MAG: HNH endonuclease [Dokdonella sp.]|uniref:HNH endonuclease n=2 Tax=Dokdonella sp. TaxID=2291710 RepID=UPI0031C95E8F|nr:HNH endonuclease [Xanthomonadales bacterium]MBL0223335.1 HNH endonuclease [Xanthomonadales bacterium]